MIKTNSKQERVLKELVLSGDAINVYQMVLDGRIDRFPRGFWSTPLSMDYAKTCTRYMIEEVMGSENAYNDIKVKDFVENRLTTVLQMFNGSAKRAIEYAYSKGVDENGKNN